MTTKKSRLGRTGLGMVGAKRVSTRTGVGEGERWGVDKLTLLNLATRYKTLNNSFVAAR